MTKVTRFAPSPTGPLHIGGVRTALFNYVYAKQNKGKFLIRVEDTDSERSKKEFEENILKGLSKIGISPDEPPFVSLKDLSYIPWLQNKSLNRAMHTGVIVQKKRLMRCAKSRKQPAKNPCMMEEVEILVLKEQITQY